LARPSPMHAAPNFVLSAAGGDASKRSAFEGAERSVARRRCNTLPWSRAAAARSNAGATLRSDLLSRGQSAASQDVVAMPCRGLERRRRARTRGRRFEAICVRGGRAQRRKTSLLCPAVGSSAGGALERGGDASKRSAFEGAERSVARRRCYALPWARAPAARSNAGATLRSDLLSRGQSAASQDVVAIPCRGLERPRRAR